MLGASQEQECGWLVNIAHGNPRAAHYAVLKRGNAERHSDNDRGHAQHVQDELRNSGDVVC